jgi:hypothetical protein
MWCIYDNTEAPVMLLVYMIIQYLAHVWYEVTVDVHRETEDPSAMIP